MPNEATGEQRRKREVLLSVLGVRFGSGQFLLLFPARFMGAGESACPEDRSFETLVRASVRAVSR